jgi:O-antigen/teichoic acid export membrane protein
MSAAPPQTIARLRAAFTGRSNSVSAQILRGASSTAVLKIVYTGLTFVTAILLARFLGVEEYGTFAYAMTWVLLFGVFAGLGLNHVIVADVAIYHQNGDWAHIRGMLRFAVAAVAVASVLCALVVAGIGWLLHRDEPSLYLAIVLACLLLPLRALLVPLGATQNGLRQVTYAQLPTLFVIPTSFLALFAFAFPLGIVEPSAHSAIILQTGAVVAGLLVAMLLLRVGWGTAGRPETLPAPRYEPRRWIVAGLPLILMGGMFLINSNTDILMLGAMLGPEEAGTYKAAARGAELLPYGLSIVSVPLGPVVARLYAAGQMQRLQRELVRWGRLAFGPTLLLGSIFFFKGEWFLILFGAEFVTDQNRTALAILTIGQVVHAGAGPVGLLLVMTGHRNATAWVLTGAATMNVVLNAVLIPVWGVTGAAAATASTTALFALLLVRYAVQRLNVNTAVVPFTTSATR